MKSHWPRLSFVVRGVALVAVASATVCGMCGGGDIEIDPVVRVSVITGDLWIECWPTSLSGSKLRFSAWWRFREPILSAQLSWGYDGSRAFLIFPAWLPFALVVTGWVLFRLVRRRTVSRTPACKRCGYCLMGLPAGRCPECGTPFETEVSGNPSKDATKLCPTRENSR